MNINQRVQSYYRQIDVQITQILEQFSLPALRIGIGIVFIWFGALKPLGISPANELVIHTTSWAFDPSWFIPFLGYWEMAIGVLFLIKPLNRVAIFLLALQIPGTFLPLIMVPETCFTVFPYGLTLEGQYIIKNLVIIAAAITVGSKVQE